MHLPQGSNEVTKDELLDFVVNSMTDGVDLDIGANADITQSDIWDHIVTAVAEAESINHVCKTTDDSYSGADIRYHLRTKLDIQSLEQYGDILLQRDTLEMLPDRPLPFVVDLHLQPYYGEEDRVYGDDNRVEEELYHSEARRGTTAFRGYATLYARVRNKRYMIAVRQVTDGDTMSFVLAEFLGLLENLDLAVKIMYLDSDFYDGKCLTLLKVHNYAYVIPIIRWGTEIKCELNQGWSRQIDHDLTTSLGDHSWKVDFPIYIKANYVYKEPEKDGEDEIREVMRHGYAADAPFIDTPDQAQYHYSKRFGIESAYRLVEDGGIATTTSPSAVIRFVLFLVSLVLQNAWRYLHWEYVATPRRGGRRLPYWPFQEFLDLIMWAGWERLGKRESVKTNKPPPANGRFSR